MPDRGAWAALPFDEKLDRMGNELLKGVSQCGETTCDGMGGSTKESGAYGETPASSGDQSYSPTVDRAWTTGSDESVLPRELGNSIYVVGGMGLDNGHKKQLSSCERYDHGEQRWVETHSVRTRRLGAAIAFLPGYGFFVCGGFDGVHHLKSVECLNNQAAAKTWMAMPDMPRARTFAGAVSWRPM